MADKKLVKKYLDDMTSARESGRAVVPPSRLQRGNILGGATKAFIEAGKQDTAAANAKAGVSSGSQSGDIFDRAIAAQEARKKSKGAKYSVGGVN